MAQLLLEVVEGPDAGKRVPLRGPVEIGRDPGVDFVLNDSQVSRRHARVTPHDGGAILEDLGSSNGSFTNHNEVMGPARLTDGDEILVGVSVLQVRAEHGATEQRSAVRVVPPALARPEGSPTYKAPIVAAPAAKVVPELDSLRDARTKVQAKLAPLAVLLLVALVVAIYLGVVR